MVDACVAVTADGFMRTEGGDGGGVGGDDGGDGGGGGGGDGGGGDGSGGMGLPAWWTCRLTLVTNVKNLS